MATRVKCKITGAFYALTPIQCGLFLEAIRLDKDSLGHFLIDGHEPYLERKTWVRIHEEKRIYDHYTT